ncbi:MAG: hypothetical protein P4L55_20685 [Syntrophobacteraceae bacterium]|nr:hypothetical protein [Syntrophobacteraceae bacterium]
MNHAPRLDMAGADLYLVGLEVRSGELVSPEIPCLLCKRVIINAGINRVVLPRWPGDDQIYRRRRLDYRG